MNDKTDKLDFKQWWEQAEIFAGEGSMSAAEEAWDFCEQQLTTERDKFKELWDHYQEFVRCHGADSITNLVVQRDEAITERDELIELIESLSSLLNKTAIALKGKEPELTKWSFHDIPELAERAINERNAVIDECTNVAKETAGAKTQIIKALNNLKTKGE